MKGGVSQRYELKMITTDFDKLSFHDALIESIQKEEGIISIRFKGGFMSKNHPDSEGKEWEIRNGVLHFCNVSKEVPLFWYDDVKGQPHPQPDFPLDKIMDIEFDGTKFEVGGYLDSEPWVQWFVYASEFKVEIIEKITMG